MTPAQAWPAAVTVSPRQATALRVIARLERELGVVPNRAELAVRLGLGQDTNPAYLLQPLRAKGLIVHSPRKHRAIALTAKGRQWVEDDEAAMIRAAEKLEITE